jgi:hypothetical protein
MVQTVAPLGLLGALMVQTVPPLAVLVLLGLLGLLAVVIRFLNSFIVRIPLPMPKYWRPWPVRCPLCDYLAPVFRVPRNKREWFKGGWTCRGCRAELDTFGNVEQFSLRQTVHLLDLPTMVLPESPVKAKKSEESNHSTQEMPGD